MEANALHDLTAAYALDALDSEDARAYEAHLARCERCREELAELSDTAGALAHGTGACQQTYSVVAPKSPTDSAISGESLPSHTALGPATPTEAS
jgi:anti-sigma factor RsiW